MKVDHDQVVFSWVWIRNKDFGENWRVCGGIAAVTSWEVYYLFPRTGTDTTEPLESLLSRYNCRYSELITLNETMARCWPMTLRLSTLAFMLAVVSAGCWRHAKPQPRIILNTLAKAQAKFCCFMSVVVKQFCMSYEMQKLQRCSWICQLPPFLKSNWIPVGEPGLTEVSQCHTRLDQDISEKFWLESEGKAYLFLLSNVSNCLMVSDNYFLTFWTLFTNLFHPWNNTVAQW